MIKILLALAGVTGVGKSYYKDKITEKLGFEKIKIITTREPRLGEKNGEDAQNTLNKVQTDMTNNNNELNQVYTDIQNLLKENPDLDKKLHDLNLAPAFYGQPAAQNITNTTQNMTTENSTQ